MDIVIKNCNNIVNGTIKIVKGCLNVKYGINGTGKSTIAKAIKLASENGDLTKLCPYQFINTADKCIPSVENIPEDYKVLTFNEEYIEHYVFHENLMENTFEVFVKTSNYDEHMEKIEALLKELHDIFQHHDELNELINVFRNFIESFGKNAKAGLSKSGSLFRGIGDGDKLSNIPPELIGYKPYLVENKDGMNVKWLKWQYEGKKYLDITDNCPYCLSPLANTRDRISRLSESYDSKMVEHREKIITIFQELDEYFSNGTKNKVKEIINGGIGDQQKNFLIEIKKQAESLLDALEKLKSVGFYNLRNIDNIHRALQEAKIDISLYQHFNSPIMNEKIKIINDALAEVEKQAGILKGEVAKQKIAIKKVIEENQDLINNFMQCAGYAYKVEITHQEGDNYNLVLKPVNQEYQIKQAQDHLSFGEKNALALALFMFDALKQNPDLIVLDDPISSFDGNKKFALLHMLFLSKKCLKNRTVLLLTHDFNTVIDVIHTLPHVFNPNPVGYFLSNKGGNLTEKRIEKNDILSFPDIVDLNCQRDIPNINKLIYLRRLFEIREKNGAAWNVLSSLFHKRKEPSIKENGTYVKISDDVFREGCEKIKCFVNTFDYNEELHKIMNRDFMIKLYYESKTNYEKIQLYRIINDDNSENMVVRKFVNEVFHVENDNIFQLDPMKYDTVPDYIVQQCTDDLRKLQGKA